MNADSLSMRVVDALGVTLSNKSHLYRLSDAGGPFSTSDGLLAAEKSVE